MQYIIKVVSILIAILLVGCSDNGVLSSIPQNEQALKGSANITVDVAEIGILAKASALRMTTVIVTVSADGEDTIEKEYSLSEKGGDVIDFTLEDLASFKNWTVIALTTDEAGVVIHEGTTSFYVEPSVVTEVALSLDAQYSILQTSFEALPDSITSVVLYVDGVKRDSISAVDELALSYDYLTIGEDHITEIVCYGSLFGTSMELYKGTVSVTPKMGTDQSYSLTLAWVGIEEPPAGSASMNITVGTVGTETLNTQFENHTVEYGSEKNKEKKDKK